MRHYVMVDEFTGFIWGEYRADKPEDEAIIEGCRAIDEEAGNPGRVYERRDQPSGDSCYYVYDATDLNLEIYDGQDQDMIDRVTDNARFVGIVGYTSDLDPDGAVS